MESSSWTPGPLGVHSAGLSLSEGVFSSLLLSGTAQQNRSRAQAPQANRQPVHGPEIQLQLPGRGPTSGPELSLSMPPQRAMWTRVGADLRERARQGQPYLPHSSPPGRPPHSATVQVSGIRCVCTESSDHVVLDTGA